MYGVCLTKDILFNFCLKLFRLYKTFLLWLEEPRLQEAGLFLPAFSALYNANKLSEIINGSEVKQ